MPESGVLQGGADGHVDALIEQSRQLAATPLGDRDRLASLLLAVPFVVVSVALALIAHSSRQVGLWTFVVFVASYALASRIDFEVGTGSAVPTQLVLVPMLALLPVQDVPLCVVAGLLLGGLPDYARGRVPIARSVLRFVNSWHAVGPALVLVVAGQPEPTPRNLPIYALAFVAQFAFDFGSTALRDRLGLGVSPLSLVRFMVWIWAVDLALAMGGRIVWFPTIGSPQHIAHHAAHPNLKFPKLAVHVREERPIDVLDESGRLRPEVYDIIGLIKEHDAILASGHMAPDRILAVFEAARDAGVDRLLVNHPNFVVEATHEGELLGIARTGRRVRWDAVDVYRLRDGKISEEWAADDMTAVLHQLGVYTPPWIS